MPESREEIATKARDFRQEVTDNIVALLEKGVAPWQKPWSASAHTGLPINPTSEKAYRGGNAIHLLAVGLQRGYEDPRWMTYKQASEQGWQVRKGERGTQIEFWDVQPQKGETPQTGTKNQPENNEQAIPPRLIHRVYTVFNARQMDGVPSLAPKEPKPFAAIEAGERILRNSEAKIAHDQADSAFYDRKADSIHLPPKEVFKDPGAYYGTALHELAHWTGHPNRLNRPTLTDSYRFGDTYYAKEELRAELASVFLAAEKGIPHDPNSHAAYVGSWIATLKNDKNEIFRAAHDASKAVDFVLALERDTSIADQALTAGVAPDAASAGTVKAETLRQESTDLNRDRGEIGEAEMSPTIAAAEGNVFAPKTSEAAIKQPAYSGPVAEYVRAVEQEVQMESREVLRNKFYEAAVHKQGGYLNDSHHDDANDVISRKAHRAAERELREWERKYPGFTPTQLLEQYNSQAVPLREHSKAMPQYEEGRQAIKTILDDRLLRTGIYSEHGITQMAKAGNMEGLEDKARSVQFVALEASQKIAKGIAPGKELKPYFQVAYPTPESDAYTSGLRKGLMEWSHEHNHALREQIQQIRLDKGAPLSPHSAEPHVSSGASLAAERPHPTPTFESYVALAENLRQDRVNNSKLAEAVDSLTKEQIEKRIQQLEPAQAKLETQERAALRAAGDPTASRRVSPELLGIERELGYLDNALYFKQQEQARQELRARGTWPPAAPSSEQFRTVAEVRPAAEMTNREIRQAIPSRFHAGNSVGEERPRPALTLESYAALADSLREDRANREKLAEAMGGLTKEQIEKRIQQLQPLHDQLEGQEKAAHRAAGSALTPRQLSPELRGIVTELGYLDDALYMKQHEQARQEPQASQQIKKYGEQWDRPQKEWAELEQAQAENSRFTARYEPGSATINVHDKQTATDRRTPLAADFSGAPAPSQAAPAQAPAEAFQTEAKNSAAYVYRYAVQAGEDQWKWQKEGTLVWATVKTEAEALRQIQADADQKGLVPRIKDVGLLRPGSSEKEREPGGGLRSASRPEYAQVSTDSLQEASALTNKLLGEEAKTSRAQVESGLYRGPVIGETPELFLQRLSPRSVIAHPKELFEHAPALGANISVNYSQAKPTVREWKERERAIGVAR